MTIIEKIKKQIGITRGFLSRRKKRKFNLMRFLRFGLGNYGNHYEAEWKYKHYRKVKP